MTATERVFGPDLVRQAYLSIVTVGKHRYYSDRNFIARFPADAVPGSWAALRAGDPARLDANTMTRVWENLAAMPRGCRHVGKFSPGYLVAFADLGVADFVACRPQALGGEPQHYPCAALGARGRVLGFVMPGRDLIRGDELGLVPPLWVSVGEFLASSGRLP